MVSICTGAEKAATAQHGSPPTAIHALLAGQEHTQLTAEATTMRPRAKAKPAAPKTNPPAAIRWPTRCFFLQRTMAARSAAKPCSPACRSSTAICRRRLFERAAAKAGLEAKAVRRKLAEIPALVLPAVLSMRDGSTRILLAIDLDTKTASVVDPARTRRRSRARCTSSTPNILASHSWCARRQQPTPRAVAAGDLPRAHWFWSVVAPLLVELQPCCDRRADRERAGAGKPALHHERL